MPLVRMLEIVNIETAPWGAFLCARVRRLLVKDVQAGHGGYWGNTVAIPPAFVIL